MFRRYLRVALAALALILATAGSLNLNRAGANDPAGGGLCGDICGCNGGVAQCCSSGGVTCYVCDTPGC